MSEPFVGQVQIFGFNFAPRNWALCAGQLMPIAQNTALFSLLGTSFGGDGKTTFGLPDFQGRAGCGMGQGPGLTPRYTGDSFGSENVTLTSGEMPAHNHGFNIFNQSDTSKRRGTPEAGDALLAPGVAQPFVPNAALSGNFPVQTIGVGGGGQPHPNQQPYLTLNFCIALQGVFPQRP